MGFASLNPTYAMRSSGGHVTEQQAQAFNVGTSTYADVAAALA